MSDLPQLQIGNRVVFTIAVRDIFATPVDAIVNPANIGLSHGGGLAEIISRMAGSALDKECDALIERQGTLKTSDAVITTAGLLDFNAVIHAAGPIMGCGDELEKLEQTISNVLTVAEQANQQQRYQISSVAFPMISTGVYCVPREICAQAFANVMKRYMYTDAEKKISSVWLCVGLDDYELFAQHFDAESRAPEQVSDDKVAEFDLSEQSISNCDDSDIDDWFN